MLRAVLLAAAIVAIVALPSASPDAPAQPKPDPAKLLDRIFDDVRALGRDGIYLSGGSPKGRDVELELLNPSARNRAELRKRYGVRVRVAPKPAGQASACPGYDAEPVADGPQPVPDVRGLPPLEAERALVAAGLRFELGCRGDGSDRPRAPRAWEPEALGRITGQCPAAGQPVAAGTSVVLGARADLPGGFPYRFGPFTEQRDRPCEDGRNLEPAPVPPEERVASPRGYTEQLPAGGPPTAIAAAGGTLVWFTTSNARPTASGSTGRRLTLHTLAPGGAAPTGVAVRSRRELRGMTAGTDAAGRLVVLAIAASGYPAGSDDPEPFGADVVAIDARTGVVRTVGGLARTKVAERPPSPCTAAGWPSRAVPNPASASRGAGSGPHACAATAGCGRAACTACGSRIASSGAGPASAISRSPAAAASPRSWRTRAAGAGSIRRCGCWIGAARASCRTRVAHPTCASSGRSPGRTITGCGSAGRTGQASTRRATTSARAGSDGCAPIARSPSTPPGRVTGSASSRRHHGGRGTRSAPTRCSPPGRARRSGRRVATGS